MVALFLPAPTRLQTYGNHVTPDSAYAHTKTINQDAAPGRGHTRSPSKFTRGNSHLAMSAEGLRSAIKSYKERVDRYVKAGRDEEAEREWIELQKLERKLEKEEAKLPTHPA